jgi:hypothetical protein
VSLRSRNFDAGAQESTTMDLPLDWDEFFGLFNSNRVRYLVVGAHALAANGRPRATADLDIFVEPTTKNARAVVAALTAFGYRALAKEVGAFATPDRMATLGRPPLRIDIMTSITGVTFAEAWKSKLSGKMGSHAVFFLGKKALIRNKVASGRAKDLLDVSLLSEGDAPLRRASPGSSTKKKSAKRSARKQPR